MQILKSGQLDQAIKILKKGQTLVFPTLTSYGLGCDATNQEAVDKIFEIKQRDKNKPLLMVVPTVLIAKKYLADSELLDNLANKYWPGPLTIIGIAKQNSGLANGVISKNNTMAVRVTNHPVVKELTTQLDKPIVATSANISRTDKVYNGGNKAEEIFSNTNTQPDAILDFGQLVQTLPTTLADISRGEVKILRQGEVILSS